MERELDKAKKNAEEARSQWESLRKERDFHRENFSKTVNEKNAILNDYKTLNNLHEDFVSKIDDLKLKYEHLCKSKSLMKLDAEKLTREKEQKTSEKNKLQSELERFDFKIKKELEEEENKNRIFNLPGVSGKEKTPWPSDVRNNLYLLKNYNPMNINLNISKQIKAHETKPASCMAVHFKMHVVATGGDDATFKIWDMKNNEELASEIGHSDYITGIDLHPKGMFLATCSGDSTVKLWDLYNLKAKSTFYDHNAVVWSVKFHDTGDFILSCSEDSSIKLFDLNHEKCRAKYMGHTDSVNKISFQPFTNYFASCSADKSISIWDMRLGLTVQTFYGHMNNINDVIFNSRGDILYSCDADGVVKSWDIRKVAEM
jgi:WD40 repeat protein